MAPGPMRATARRGRRGPKMASTRKPAKGRAGTSHSRSSISSFHPADGIDIQRPIVVIEPQHKRQADRDFGGGHREDKDEYHLSVWLRPARAGDDEREARGVQHDLERRSEEHTSELQS